jgi:hypothetical protein
MDLYQDFNFSLGGVRSGRVVNVDDVLAGVALLHVVDYQLCALASVLIDFFLFVTDAPDK